MARILLAEDNPINQELIKNMLELLACQIEITANGREVLSAWSSGAYDLVLMDGQMPEMDGYEATRRIREYERAASERGEQEHHTIIIALTGHAMEGDREQCLAVGMDDYVSKPFTLKQLQSALARWLPQQFPAQKSASRPGTISTSSSEAAEPFRA